MIPQNEMDVTLDRETITLSFLVVIISLPLLLVPFSVDGTARFAGLLSISMVVVWVVGSLLGDLACLRFNSFVGPDMAYHSGIFAEPKVEAQVVIGRLNIGNSPGYIYIMRRADGVYKIGRTDNTNRRQKQHIGDYGMGFVLVRRFVVSDTIQFEKLALHLTAEYAYPEKRRQELRRMNDDQIEAFIEFFNTCCILSVSK